jgi:hypothetical protein
MIHFFGKQARGTELCKKSEVIIIHAVYDGVVGVFRNDNLHAAPAKNCLVQARDKPSMRNEIRRHQHDGVRRFSDVIFVMFPERIPFSSDTVPEKPHPRFCEYRQGVFFF